MKKVISLLFAGMIIFNASAFAGGSGGGATDPDDPSPWSIASHEVTDPDDPSPWR